MSWASRRKTTRAEDEAYSLLGLFNVNMALLYGEGQKAFLRLQHEIMQTSEDHTLFAWGFEKYARWQPFADFKMTLISQGLATSAWNFHNVGDLKPYRPRWLKSSQYTKTNKGVLITLPSRKLPSSDAVIVALNCAKASVNRSAILALPLLQLGEEEDVYERFSDSVPIIVSENCFRDCEYRSIYIKSDVRHSRIHASVPEVIGIDLNSFLDQGFKLIEVYPPPLEVYLDFKIGQIRLRFPYFPKPIIFKWTSKELGDVLLLSSSRFYEFSGLLNVTEYCENGNDPFGDAAQINMRGQVTIYNDSVVVLSVRKSARNRISMKYELPAFEFDTPWSGPLYVTSPGVRATLGVPEHLSRRRAPGSSYSNAASTLLLTESVHRARLVPVELEGSMHY